MMDNSIIIVATSDFNTDQRIQRTASSLHNNGYNVVVFARKSNYSTSTPFNAPYKIKRIGTAIRKGPLFYLTYNLKIIHILLFSECSMIYANDLDTLFACTVVARIKRKPLIYDSHELFTEIPELVNHKFKKKTWQIIENVCIKQPQKIITVSNGVAEQLKLRYGVEPIIVRNLPNVCQTKAKKATIPTIIYQGYLNINRGIELIISAMVDLPNFQLLIAGIGEIEDKLKEHTHKLKLDERVKFLGRIAPDKLRQITASAWLGVSLEEDIGLNYRHALPNKIFDYIAANIPILVSNLPDMRQIVDDYGVGIVVESRKPEDLAQQIAAFCNDTQQQKAIAANLKNAAQILNWQNEKQKLIEVVNSVSEKHTC